MHTSVPNSPCLLQTNSSADKKKALALWPKVVAAIRKDERIRRLEKNIKGKQESVWTWELAGDEVPHVVRSWE